MKTRLVLGLTALLAAVASSGCHGAAPEATDHDMYADAAPPPSASASGSVAGSVTGPAAAAPTSSVNPLEDLKSKLSQKQTPPLGDPRDLAPVPKREPDWDLDKRDAARDYVRRYIWGVARYGDASHCVEPQASVPANGKTEVQVADAVPPRCPPTGVDETFAVDVAADRLELVRQQVDRPKLKPWLDGSDPYAPPKVPVPEFADPNKWKTPTGMALKEERLAPIRIQIYGRGTYPFVTIAGWPAWFPRTMDQTKRDAFAAKICRGSQGLPLAIAAGLDRSNVLRVRCGTAPTAVWEQL